MNIKIFKRLFYSIGWLAFVQYSWSNELIPVDKELEHQLIHLAQNAQRNLSVTGMFDDALRQLDACDSDKQTQMRHIAPALIAQPIPTSDVTIVQATDKHEISAVS